MSIVDRIHQDVVYSRRTQVLSEMIASSLPEHAQVLDVGCGDGLISAKAAGLRPDVTVTGIDVLLRPQTFIEVTHFDGQVIPFADKSFDSVVFVDVLHHTDDPTVLLREAARVARHSIVIKDHTKNGLLAGPTLHFMDWVGNARHGVRIPANYWSRERWKVTFDELGLDVVNWNARVPLYPAWASWLFGRSLHFVAVLKGRDKTV
jgi:SAM-dependent methyltransferase